jgi:hypothetical protein
MEKLLRLYGTSAIRPINFPDELEERHYLRDRKTNEQIRVSDPQTGERKSVNISLTPYRSWDWIRANYPVPQSRLDECVKALESGVEFPLVDFTRELTFDEEFVLPEECKASLDE